MGLTRRGLLTATGAACAALAGCSNDGTAPTAPADVKATPTGTVGSTPPEPTPTASPSAYLPGPGAGWTLDRTERYTQKERGGADGVRGYYTGPDGRAYQVVVLRSGAWAPRNARAWRCAGWQVAFALDGVAVGASTGTEQRTFTPERPPTMTRSPIPGTEPRVRDLLARTPRIDPADIPATSTCD